MLAYFVYNLKSYSGAARQALSLSQLVGCQVVIFNVGEKLFSKEYFLSKITIINLPENKFLSVFIFIWYCFKHKIKLVHFHGFFPYYLIFSKILGKKTILKTTLLGDDDFQSLLKKIKYKWLFGLFIRCINVNICLTNQLKGINSRFINSNRIEIIPNGVFISKFTDTHKDNIFCFVGLICERKRAKESIQYFLENYSELDGAKMYVVGPDGIIGKIAEEDQNYVDHSKEMVVSHKNGHKVIFTGLLPSDQTVKILQKSKALIFFSEREGMPNVVLEALANNCAPITTGISGVMEEILPDHLKNFILLNPSTKLSIKLIDLELERLSLVKHAEKFYDLNKIANRYNKLYSKLIDN